MAKFLTTIGKQKMLSADPLNPISIKSVAIGTGTGAIDENILSLKAEVWRGDASAPMKKGNLLGFSAFVPIEIGGWEMTEWGWIDSEGDLIAYGQLDNPIYKTPNVTDFNPELFIELTNSIDAEIFVTNDLNWEHNKMTGREVNDAHPISSITGLNDALSDLQDSINIDRKYKKVNADYTILNDDGGVLEIDASAGPLNITMPKSTSFTSKEITLVRSDDTENLVNIIGANGDSFFAEGRSYTGMNIKAREVFYFKAGNNLFTGLRGNINQIHDDADGYALYRNGIKIGLVLLDNDVINNLTSTNTKKPLSAAQGKVLNDSKVAISSIVNNLTSSSTTAPLSANQGRVLLSQMFGIGQSVKDISSSTVSGSTYTNTGTKLKMISIYTNIVSGSTSREVLAYLDGALWGRLDTDSNTDGQITIPVPPSSTWRVTANNLDIGTSVFVKELS